MNYKEFLESLEELQLDLDSAAEALDLEISEIQSWENEESIPKLASEWIRNEKIELPKLDNSNEDENFEEDEDEDIEDLEDENIVFEEEEK
tara:strand:- start:186 stop:458 length:273 start_codon:yes stop_codon:yes gene_type:complete